MTVLNSSALVSLLLLQSSAVPPQQPVNAVVTAVSAHVSELWDALPDLICEEKITSTTFESGNIRNQKIVESVFTSSRQNGPQRTITAVDSKPAKKNAKMPDLPVNLTTNFGFVIQATFTPTVLKFHDYVYSPKSGKDGTIVVQFETKSDQQKIKWDFGGKSQTAKDAGIAWIDASTMQVVRIERNFLNLPNGISRIAASSDYAPVMFGRNSFWLPKNLRIETAERDTRKTGLFLAEYRNCRKYGADVTLVP